MTFLDRGNSPITLFEVKKTFLQPKFHATLQFVNVSNLKKLTLLRKHPSKGYEAITKYYYQSIIRTTDFS